jgi:heme-degrading monooxygenase HmoA
MYLRFLQLHVREEALPDFLNFYTETVFPVLQRTEGCLFACMLRQANEPTEVISVTVWENRDAAETYNKSDDFHRLLGTSQQYYAQVEDPESPPAEVYTAADESRDALYQAGRDAAPNTYLRIVEIHFKPGRMQEFKDHFDARIIPALQQTKGCRSIFLVERAERSDEVLSITVWDREEDAVRYEMSGLFDDLAAPVRDTFAGLHGWQMASPGPLGTARDELEVHGYDVIAGGRL